MIETEISRSETDTAGRYEIRVDGHDESGELTYQKLADGTIVADHTGVPISMRGLGIGKALVAKLANDALDERFQIVPTCPFVKAHLERNPDWIELIKEQTL